MQSLMLVVCFMLTLALSAAGPSAETIALYNARKNGALICERLRVVDQDGVPVASAKIWGGLQTGDGLGDNTPVRGLTDTNGVYVVHGRVTRIFHCEISKSGYYTSMRDFIYGDANSDGAVKEGKWQPYGNTRTFVIRKMICPNVTGKRYLEQTIPAFGKWLDYDLEAADWTEPNGRGKVSDLRIRLTVRDEGTLDFCYKMELSFEHVPFAGAYARKKDMFSEMRCDYNATTNDVAYSSKIVFEVDRSGRTIRKWNLLDKDSYMVFRVRTRVDEYGRLVAAHYGRIDGEWRFYERHGMTLPGIYFNVKENDTNLEDEYTAKESIRRIQDREAAPYKKKRKSLWPF